MKASVDLWKLNEINPYEDLKIPITIEGLGDCQTTIWLEISGLDSQFKALLNVLLRTAKESDRAINLARLLKEAGHMLEGFQCPRCHMDAMGAQEQNPNTVQEAP
jgi:hypothetical protein